MLELGVVDFLEQCHREGKFRWFGFSFHDEYGAFEEILRARNWDFCQIQLNYMDRDIQAGLRGHDLALELGVEGEAPLRREAGLLFELDHNLNNGHSFLPAGKLVAATGQLLGVDGELLEEDYINEPTYVEEGTEFPLTVPEGSIFVMGDNRNHSSDSRSSDLGTVDTRYVIGRAVFLLFPGADEATGQRDFGRIGGIDRIG